MPSLSEVALRAFRDELHKEAGVAELIAQAKPRLQSAGALAGVGALGGGAIGAGIGAVKGYRDARADGASVGRSALQGLTRGLGGGIHGAGLGALAGGAAGALTKMDPSKLVGREGILGSAARSGQRQVHAMTGMLSPAELEGIRGGAFDARQRVGELDRMGAPRGRAGKALEASEKAQEMGLTSVPGYLKALKNQPGQALSTSIKEQYYGMHPAMGAAMVGLPLASAAGTLARNERPDGAGKGEEIGHNLGGAAGGLMGGLMPVGGAEVMSRMGGAAGSGVGRVIDRIRGRKPLVNDLGNPSTLEPSESQNTPSERVMSPSAAGGQKDVGL
jgi:hypothetical protein